MILRFLIIDSNIITLLYICTSMKGIIIPWWLSNVVSSCGNVSTYYVHTQQDTNNKKHVSRQTLYNTIQHQQFLKRNSSLLYDYRLYVLGSVWHGLYYIVWHCVYRCVFYCEFVEYCARTDVQIIKVNTVSVI